MENSLQEKIVWSLWIRVIHFLLAVGIIFNLFVLEEGDPPHQWIGYFLFALVSLRIILGFFDKSESSFRHWPMSFSHIKIFLKNHLSRQGPQYFGHNPAACYVYFGIWITVFCLGFSGWMMGLDAFWGEEWLEEVHGIFAKVMMVLVSLHLIGIAMDAYIYRRKSWLVMFDGKKRPPGI